VEASQSTSVIGDGGTAVEVSQPDAGKPLLDVPQSMTAGVAMWVAVLLPLIGLAVAIPVGWGWGLSILDLSMAATAYVVTGLAVTVGYHRGFTHRSFKARRGLRIALAVGGSLAVEGSPVQWVANHRRHHAFSDREGDPHSPWRYGTDTRALLKGMIYAHVGWMLKRELSNRARFAPDLLADRDLRAIGRFSGVLVAVSLLVPAAVGEPHGCTEGHGDERVGQRRVEPRRARSRTMGFRRVRLQRSGLLRRLVLPLLHLRIHRQQAGQLPRDCRRRTWRDGCAVVLRRTVVLPRVRVHEPP